MGILSGFFATCRFTTTLAQPAQAAGSFVLNGASNPTQKAGIVESVRRLVDAGGDPFFRVRVNTRLPLNALSTIIVGSVRGTAIADEPGYNIVAITAAPATTKDTNYEMDVAILNAGVAVDTADFWFQFHVDAATALSGIVEAT